MPEVPQDPSGEFPQDKSKLDEAREILEMMRASRLSRGEASTQPMRERPRFLPAETEKIANSHLKGPRHSTGHPDRWGESRKH